MFKIQTLNNISVAGLERFPRDRYEIASEMNKPDALLLRSFNMHNLELPATLKAVGRAGAGVNNIPVDSCTKLGIPVFNAPGANANAVKELVLAAMLLSSRNIVQAWDFTRQLNGSDEEIDKIVESEKKKFLGIELAGRTLGVAGLGAIGVKVANAALSLGMKVIGYDPHITVSNAWQLHSDVKGVSSMSEVLASSDFVTVHVPLVAETTNLIDSKRLGKAKTGITILNFARPGIADEEAILQAINSGKVRAYVCDFPSNRLKGHPKVISLPHLGASTSEAEENCAIMVADQLRNYLEFGEIKNSVNFPDMHLPQGNAHRMLVANANVPHMIERISAAVSNANINILDMLNRSRGEVACTMLDLQEPAPQAVIDEISAVKGVLKVRVLDLK
jgi:D-3-phosphoglycerate dehydrogenase